MIDLRGVVEQPAMQALAWSLLHFLWQGAALGVAAFVVLRIVKPERASTRYLIGVFTLALMLASSLATFVAIARQPMPLDDFLAFTQDPAATPLGSGVTGWVIADLSSNPTARSLVAPIEDPVNPLRPQPLGPLSLFLIVSTWSIGVLALTCRLVGGWIVTRRLARRAIDTVSPAVEAAAARIAERLRLRRAVGIFESSAVAAPTLVGWLKPVVLLPAAALSGLSQEQLQAILAHELAHVRRHDYLVNLLQSVVETLLFYHPATWWVSAQVREEREHCCDDLAIEVCGDRLVYVTALAELTAMGRHPGFALAATDGSLVGRVRRLLGAERPRHEAPPGWAALGVFVLALAGTSGAPGALGALGTPGAAGAVQDPVDVVLTQNPPVAPVPTTPSEPGSPANPAQHAPPPAPPAPQQFPAPPAPQQFPAPPAPPALSEFPAPPAPPALSELPPPPAPPVSPVPAEPPAPPTPAQQGHGHMQWSHNDEKVSLKWTGPFRLTDDERDVAWVEEGATVTISNGTLFASRVDLKGLPGGRIERMFSKNAFKREYEPEGRQFLAEMLQKIVQRSGMFAKERVARFLKQGGPDAVLAEIERIGDSSYVKRVYLTELMKQSEITESTLNKVLQRVATDMRSDYDRATLLAEILKLPAITEAHRVSVARTVKSISSDYDQRRTLAAVMDAGALTPAVSAAILDTLGTINSNYDRSLVLIALSEKGGITPETTTQFLAHVRTMSSSYDQRRVLTAVSKQSSLPSNFAVEAAKVIGAMSSSYDQAEMLLALIKRGGLTDSASDAFFATAAEIKSSHDLGRVLNAVVAEPDATERMIAGVLRAAARISSNHDRANVLVNVANRHGLSAQNRTLYLAAAEGISSSFDMNRALAALVKAERR